MIKHGIKFDCYLICILLNKRLTIIIIICIHLDVIIYLIFYNILNFFNFFIRYNLLMSLINHYNDKIIKSYIKDKSPIMFPKVECTIPNKKIEFSLHP